MRRGFPRYLVMTVALLGVGALASAFLAQGPAAAPDGQHQASVQAHAANRSQFTKTLVADLRRRGFQVSPGYPFLWKQGACAYLYRALQNCFGNNPVAPYVIAVVKAWRNEYVGPTPPNVFGPQRPGYMPIYRLGQRDAVVIYGKMPPPGMYMSEQSWEWSAHGLWTTKTYNKWKYTTIPRRAYPMEYEFETIPPNDPQAGRAWTFDSLGDPVNSLFMQRQSGSPFGKTRYFIITASATTDRAVRRVLQARGARNSEIFTEKVPSRYRYGATGPLGMGKNAVDFFTLLRYVLPDNQAAAQQWFANPPLTVMRVRAPSSLGPVRRYGLLTYGKRAGRSEAFLAGDLQRLVDAVCARASSTANLESAGCAQPPPASSFISAVINATDPQYCRKVKMWCGDQSDSALFVTRPLPLDAGQVYAVVDTLATETGNAMYVSLGVNDASTYLAPTGVTDTVLKGSADPYANTVNNAGKFFVHYFTRNCNALGKLLDRQQDCTSITDQMVQRDGNTSALGDPDLKGKFWPLLRDVIAPGTEHGPAYSELLRARILAFTRQ